MCYSGVCEFEDSMGECRLKPRKYTERVQWARDNHFIYCGTGLDEKEYFERKLWIFINKEKYEQFKKEFL